MKIAIFSDIHGNLQALERIVEDIKNQNIDKIICLGDIIGIGPNPKECLEIIMNNEIEMVLGNHELYYLYGTKIDSKIEEGEINHHNWIKEQLNEKYYNYLEQQPSKIEFNNMLFEHFLIDDNKKDLYPFYSFDILKKQKLKNNVSNSKYNRIFIGHEHKPFETDKIICVGTSGCTKDNKTSYIIIDTNNNYVHKRYLNYDREKFIETLKNKQYPDKGIISKIFFGIEI